MLKIPFGTHMCHSLKNGKDGQGEQLLQWSEQETNGCAGRVVTGNWGGEVDFGSISLKEVTGWLMVKGRV